jgi:hypothetical protein
VSAAGGMHAISNSVYACTHMVVISTEVLLASCARAGLRCGWCRHCYCCRYHVLMYCSGTGSPSATVWVPGPNSTASWEDTGQAEVGTLEGVIGFNPMATSVDVRQVPAYNQRGAPHPEDHKVILSLGDEIEYGWVSPWREAAGLPCRQPEIVALRSHASPAQLAAVAHCSSR